MLNTITPVLFDIDEGKIVNYLGNEILVPLYTNFLAITPKNELLAFYAIHTADSDKWVVHCDEIDDEVEDDWVNWTQDLYFPNSAATEEVCVGTVTFTGDWQKSQHKV
ncbi:MAG: hypothetical protein KAG98_01875 [Lentisphaeria bacterium]|nr:hypothetical protein [Lentisphaeria bacterium]